VGPLKLCLLELWPILFWNEKNTNEAQTRSQKSVHSQAADSSVAGYCFRNNRLQKRPEYFLFSHYLLFPLLRFSHALTDVTRVHFVPSLVRLLQ
jgi:hypothetical protein